MVNDMFGLWQYWATKGLPEGVARAIFDNYSAPVLLFDASFTHLSELGVSKEHYRQYFNLDAIKKAESHVMMHLNEGIQMLIPRTKCVERSDSSWLSMLNGPLYIKGTLPKIPMAAVIGTRNISKTGEVLTEMVTEKLVRDGYGIMGGLSLGVELLAHRAALNVGAPTVAFVPHALDTCYPKRLISVMKKIAEEGAVVSLHALATPFQKSHFCERNDLIARLCDQIVLVEASEESGAIYTALQGLKWNKATYAVKPDVRSKENRGNIVVIDSGGKIFPLETGCFQVAPDILKDKLVGGFVRSEVIGVELSYSQLLALQSEGWLVHRHDGRWQYRGWIHE